MKYCFAWSNQVYQPLHIEWRAILDDAFVPIIQIIQLLVVANQRI